MAFKFVVAFALVAVAFAGYVPQPQVYHAVAHQEPSQHVLTKSVEEYDPHPQYNVAYNVHDSVTGDVKSQSESRDGDVVNGEYSLIDADGYKRTVSYSADDEHGFNAVVNRVPLHQAEHDSHAPVDHASPSHTYSAPATVKTYTAPSYHHQAAPAVAKTVSYGAPSYYHQASPSAVVKTVSPVSYGAPSYYHQAAPSAVAKTVSPVSYGAPTYHHHAVSAPVSPVSYAVPSYHQVVAAPTVSYSAPSHYKASPAVTYSTSNVVAKSASPVTYSVAAAPSSHAEHQYVASSPSYAVPVNYHAHPESVQYVASSPSVAKTTYHKAAPSTAYATSESYSSPAYVKSSESSNQYHH